MPNDHRCPSCGHPNAPDATACASCNFPLHPELGEATPAPAGPAPTPEPETGPASRGYDPSIRRVRPIRPRRPRGPEQQLQTQLWVILGGLAVVIVLFTAFQGFKKNNPADAPVAGAQQEQQHIADMARAELAKDSTNVNARIALANVLYDTGNWSEAIIHYKAALRADPGRIESLVDLGVCYYNLSQPDEALSLFKQALELDPKHPIALFNLGVVSEGQGKLEDALHYYRRAKEANPPPSMLQPLQQSIDRITQQLGQPAPAPGGSR